ncbi:unnamed protein product [Rhizoctonia solani]|uniref:CHAT domain-containing protein n=1 Tax=Rhizoctonia solani TaxID=456999 RepID=A0A8H2XKE2_9AGAM|nr:unnamed protein product [Rhizoctonia solani]
MAILLTHLGVCHGARFQLRGEPEDIDKAIEYTTTGLAITPDDDLDLPDILTKLGLLHDHRYKRLSDVDDSKKSIEYTARALSLTPDGHPELPSRLGNLGSFHGTRFQNQGVLEDIAKAIEYISRAIALIPRDHPDLPHRLDHLGVTYSIRIDRLGELGDIEKAIEYNSQAVALTPNGDPNLANRLASLAVSNANRYEHLGELDDLEKAIECGSRALVLTPDGHPALSGRLANLAVSHSHRFRRVGELDDLEKAIKYQYRALALTPDGHPDLSWHFHNLGASHTHRFRRLDELSDLKKAIEYGSRALALTPDGHPHLSGRLANLAVSHIDQFKRLGELSDLEKAIEYQSRGLELIPNDHPDLPSRLDILGVSHDDRFLRLGVLSDLDKAIEYESRALELTPDGHPDLSSRLANLAVSHNHRFERLGELGDLEKAMEYDSRAVTSTPEGHPLLSRRLANLGISHSDRFERLGELGDLEKAIEYESRALVLTPEDHPDLPNRLAILALPHKNRFERLGDLNDIEKAIEYQSRALALTPDGHPHLPGWLQNLGVSHAHRFGQLGMQHDLNKVIECMSRALVLTPDGHPTLPNIHFPLATHRLFQYHRTRDPSDLHDSFNSFRLASQSLAGSPRDSFRYALGWAEAASKESLLNCIEAYQRAMDLLPQFIWLGATTNQRYQDLEQVQNLAVRAAAAAIASSDYKLALEWLEHARCVVWNQHLMLRSPHDLFHASHPTLATRLQAVATQLHEAGSESRESRACSSGSFTPEQIAQRHRQLAKEYEDLLSQARTIAGFENFLQPVKAKALLQAAQNGPIIVINCHEDRSDALIILPGQDTISHIPLPNFTEDKAQRTRVEMGKLVRGRRPQERGVDRRPVPRQEAECDFDFGSVLAVLWDDIVKPILDFLGFIEFNSIDNMPHITWCPTGALSFLPLHAAGDYDRPRSRIFDYAISSYTPTLTALLTSASSSLSCNTRVLAIGQENTPGQSSLPGTAKELIYVKSHTQTKFNYSQLTGDQATTTAVLDAMEQHDWVHLACHAHQNVQDPTKSGFFLYDDTLDLASINRRSFKNKGLAFLSACQTATGDEKLPDEAIHLASGMLMAGYSSVIGTMWSVVDEDAPFVADKVYDQLMKEERLGNGEAGKALHKAVAELREKVGEKEFWRWVPYIHIGS